MQTQIEKRRKRRRFCEYDRFNVFRLGRYYMVIPYDSYFPSCSVFLI